MTAASATAYPHDITTITCVVIRTPCACHLSGKYLAMCAALHSL
jgi:hypothetical protein